MNIDGAFRWVHTCHPCPTKNGAVIKLGGEFGFEYEKYSPNDDEGVMGDLNCTPCPRLGWMVKVYRKSCWKYQVKKKAKFSWKCKKVDSNFT